MTKFLIDDGSFTSLTSSNLEKAVASFCDYTAELKDMSFQLEKQSDIYNSPVIGGLKLVDLIYTELSPLSKAARQRLSTAINRTINFNNSAPYSLDLSGTPITDTTLTHAFELAESGQPNSCVAVDTGLRTTGWSSARRVSDSLTNDLHFGMRRLDLISFFRGAIILSEASEEDFLEFGRIAFPDLVFHPNIANQFNKFSRPYAKVREDLVKILSGLNDHFVAIRHYEKGDASKVTARMAAACGLDCSPESPKTHESEKLMVKRDVVFNNKTFRCEWHAKLLPQIDRIHFFPEFEGTKILVGIFTEHLPT